MIIKIKGHTSPDSGGTVYLNDKLLLPHRSQKVFNHSPDGFAWGYCGSGPAQLALAVLLEITTLHRALQNYQAFKADVIARIQGDNFDEKIDVTNYI
jgi:hypothetical protein